MQGNPTRVKSSRRQARRLVKIAHPHGQKIRPCSATASQHHIERRCDKIADGQSPETARLSQILIFGSSA